MIAAYDRSGFTVEYGPGGSVNGRWSPSNGAGRIGPGEDTRLTTGGGLERGVEGQDEATAFLEGVLGYRGAGILNRPRSLSFDGVSGTASAS